MTGRSAHSDRRSGGTWSHRQAAKNFFIAAAVRAALLIADRLPAPLLLVLGRLAGRAARRLMPTAGRTALARAEGRLPTQEGTRVARACFERAGESLAISALLRRPAVRAAEWVLVSTEGRAVLDRALARGRGAIVVSAHLGPFEMVAARVAELGVRPAIVVRESYDRRLDAWIDAHRRARGVDVIHRGSRHSGLQILRALRAGQPVGMLPDLGGRVPSVAARFLGDTLAFPVGPQLIAKRARCPILIGTLARRHRGSGGSAGCPFELLLSELPPDGTVATLTQRVADSLDKAILRSPEDWLWMAPRNLAIAPDSLRTLDLPVRLFEEPAHVQSRAFRLPGAG